MPFSEKIRYLRSGLDMSQEDFAYEFGVSRQTVSKWESGISYPEVDKLIAISDRLNVSIDFLLKDVPISEKNAQAENNPERLVLRFLGSSQDMEDISQKLVKIMRDGVIDENEKLQMQQLNTRLDAIIENINKIRKLSED